MQSLEIFHHSQSLLPELIIKTLLAAPAGEWFVSDAATFIVRDCSSDAIFKVQGPVQRDDIRLVILISKRDVIQLEGYNAIRKTLEDYFSTDVASVVGNFSLCGRDVANPGVVMKSERIPLA